MNQSRKVTRKSASNLALAFVLLPRAKRDDMSALYAFCRQVDDIADDEQIPVERRRAELESWREDVRAACENRRPAFPVNQELQQVIARNRLPFHCFDELIRGVEMDLDIRRYETLDALEEYCFRVASVVGLLSIEIFGYRNLACREYAICLGKALQLTNILRDVRSDAERGRIYLPADLMARFGVLPEEVLRLEYSERFERLAQAVADRARLFYRRAREALPAEDRRRMIAAELMGAVYWRLLGEIERRRFNVFGALPARLNKAQKTLLIARTWYRLARGIMAPNYGSQ